MGRDCERVGDVRACVGAAEIAEFSSHQAMNPTPWVFIIRLEHGSKPSTYPAVVELKGVLDGAELHNGVPSEFLKK